MAIKIASIIGESQESFEAAVASAVSEASKTNKNITGVEVLNLTANVENGRIVEYKANVNVAFQD